ncbi:hypothetical protein NDU88_003204 [Pleurodeles waltl]|uniref:Uncharacterized protein n=1 Tax=Pleurodeles waltl TaxID=8319 RepID=A0AAV7NG10_PLEWA|nr:hypothetical protein NDU88_003204 [Pleurodeles waltl]
MGAPQQHSKGLIGLSWLRARLELGRSWRVAARLPFRVRAGRVSTDADRLQNEDMIDASLKQVANRCRNSSNCSSICLSFGKTALHEKVGGRGSEERDDSQPGMVHYKLDSMRHHTQLDRQSLPQAKLDIGEGSGNGGFKPLKNIKTRKKTASSKLTPSAKTFFKVEYPDKLVTFEGEMDGSASRDLEMEPEGEDGCQGGRHSPDSQQQPSTFQGTLVGQQKAGEVMINEEIAPQSVSSLVDMLQGSGVPVPPPDLQPWLSSP